MKFLVILALFCVASVFGLKKDELGTGFPDSWYEEQAENAEDDGLNTIPHFLDADEDFSEYFGNSIASMRDPKNILQVAQENGASIFVKAAHLVGLHDEFSNLNDITAFIPSNRAFARLPKLVYLFLLRHPSRLRYLLKYHVVQGTFKIDDLEDDGLLPTLLGNLTTRYDKYDHPNSNHTTHVIQGSHIHRCKTDLVASNGIVHIIDDVILRFSLVSSHYIISHVPAFSKLYDGLIVAGLADSLRNGSQTIFAPTDKAFKKLGPGVWEKLLSDKAALTAVLDLHIVADKTYFARGFRNNDVLSSLSKADSLTIHVRNDRTAAGVSRRGEFEVFVNEAKILFFDGVTKSGVIHAIDAVLIPPSVMDRLNALDLED